MTLPSLGFRKFYGGPDVDIPDMSIGLRALPFAMTEKTAKISPQPPFKPDKYAILERHKGQYAAAITEASHLLLDLASIVADYAATVPAMDRDGWKKYYGVDIGEEPKHISEAFQFDRFYEIYHGPNPMDQTRTVCESSSIPVVVPRSCRYLNGSKVYHLTHKRLEKLAKHPVQGRTAEYLCLDTGIPLGSTALEQHKRDRVDETRLVILLNDIGALGKPWDEQVQYLQNLNSQPGYKYEINPDALSQNTVLFANHTVTGRRMFDNKSCVRTREIVRFSDGDSHMLSGLFSSSVGGLTNGQVCISVDERGKSENFGISVMLKF